VLKSPDILSSKDYLKKLEILLKAGSNETNPYEEKVVVIIYIL
jgi:hypothetical protein